jgi:hypothetical protein
MPGFDGTGPRGQGPLTGRGEGYCAVKLPDEAGQTADGYAGLRGTPVQIGALAVRPTLRGRFACRLRSMWPGRALGRGRGAGGGRGRRFGRW